MARKSRVSDPEESVIDLTPMLDVTFILLIFFIVTAQFIKTPGVDITREDVKNDAIVSPLGILVAIDEQSRVWIAKEEVDLPEVEYTIRELREDNPRGKLIVQVDSKSEAGVLDEVMRSIQSADADTQINISTLQD